MKMFLGEYNPNITSGNRIALPKKHREQLAGDTVVLAKGFEKCILVYDLNDWSDRVERQVDNLVSEGVKRSNLERYLYTSAAEASVDSQGRVVIPSELREYSGINGKTAVIGVGDHVEVWDDESWKKHLKKISEKIPE
ncbi:division/cell wall cluster transcriptional repressor MraZ [candidate division WWE3 bacterium]|nr:division/cell wall cluster transcriptional repressor MraZ [candidate division WWE3 bacterium]